MWNPRQVEEVAMIILAEPRMANFLNAHCDGGAQSFASVAGVVLHELCGAKRRSGSALPHSRVFGPEGSSRQGLRQSARRKPSGIVSPWSPRAQAASEN